MLVYKRSGDEATSHEIEDLISEYTNTAIAWDVMQNCPNLGQPLVARLCIRLRSDLIVELLDSP